MGMAKEDWTSAPTWPDVKHFATLEAKTRKFAIFALGSFIGAAIALGLWRNERDKKAK